MPNSLSISPVRVEKYHTILVITYLIGFYTGIHFYLPFGLVVPYILVLVSGSILLSINIVFTRKTEVLSILYYLTICMASMAFTKSPFLFWMERFRGYIYLCYSIALSYGLFLELQRWPAHKINALFGGASIVILIGCLLENYSGVKYLSDQFRHIVFQSNLYESDLRDLLYYGQIRPKLFTNEPSYVALFLTLSLLIWLMLSTFRHKYIIYLILSALGMYLIRSPILLLTITNASLYFLFNDYRRYSPQKQYLALSVSVLISLAMFFFVFVPLLSGRIQSLRKQKDDSFKLRVTLPMKVAFNTLLQYPAMGIGISGTEVIEESTYELFKNNLSNPNRLKDVTKSKIFNPFWMHWLFLGLIGGLLATLSLFGLSSSLGVRHPVFCWIVICSFSPALGGYVTVRCWTFLFLIFMACAHIEPSKYSAFHIGERRF